MIQDIAPHRYDNAFKTRRPEAADYVLVILNNRTLLIDREQTTAARRREAQKPEAVYAIPLFSEITEVVADAVERAVYLFAIDEKSYFLIENKEENAVAETGRFAFKGTQYFRLMEPMYQAFAAITATQIWRWRESRKFCGRCGQRMEYSQTERAMVCPGCKQTEYPKISPAVIVAITNGDKLLMSRYAHGTYRHFALIAGYVEVGETFEECVRREVMEEVGLKVKNIRYYKSQPWAFSDTVMIGFTAELDGDDTIRLQEEELSEAGWYTRDQVEDYSPCISVGHEMMRAFKSGTL